MWGCPNDGQSILDWENMNDKLMTLTAVADYLGVPAATVYAWNSRGLGPTRYRVGKYVRYRRTDVDTWVDRQAAQTYGRAA
jgi:excisionase family DNA binding protein